MTGNNLITSLSLPPSGRPWRGLAGHAGAVVAMEPSTGRVLAMASTPRLQPKHGRPAVRQAEPARRRCAAAEPGHAGPVRARLDLQGGDRDGGPRERQVHARDQHRRPRLVHHRERAAVQRRRRDRPAWSRSRRPDVLRTTRCSPRSARRSATDRLYNDHARRTASSPIRRSTTRATRWRPAGSTTPRPPAAPSAPVDVARVAIGQERLLATPLQMAEVAATIANGGVRMRPTLVDRAVSPERQDRLHAASAGRFSG